MMEQKTSQKKQSPRKRDKKRLLKDQNNPINKAVAFLQEMKDVPQKYVPEDLQVFISQFQQLDMDQKYTCGELILSRAWSAVGSSRYQQAQKQIALILPLCQANNSVQYPQFQIDKLMWQCWVNNYQIKDQEKKENLQLLDQCGFKFNKFKQTTKKQKKSGFMEFLKKNICCCAVNH